MSSDARIGGNAVALHEPVPLGSGAGFVEGLMNDTGVGFLKS